jgi:hypothetical protein
MKVISILLSLILLVSIFFLTGSIVPVKAEDSLQYYQTNFPIGLHYSKGWYGTFSYAPKAEEVLLFDDDKGICVFTMLNGIVPKGEQGGTILKLITRKDVDTIINSYNAKELIKPYDSEITDIMEQDDYYLGAWAGEKLQQKFHHPKNLEQQKQELGELFVEVSLSQRQIEAKEAFKAKREKQPDVDLSKYDPDRYFVMGQVYIANGTGVITEVGRLIADTDLHITTQGSFTFYMANGTTCTLTENGDGATIDEGSPKALVAGSNLINITGTGTINFNITIGSYAYWWETASWSTTSGGACGASVPTDADNVLFEINSFTADSQVAWACSYNHSYCLGMNWTGATNTPVLRFGAGGYLWEHDDATFIATMTTTSGGDSNYYVLSQAADLTTNGVTINVDTFLIGEQSNVGTMNLQDNLTASSAVVCSGGTFNTNNHNITSGNITFGGAFASEITANLGSSTLTLAGNATFDNQNTLTVNAGTSIIKIAGTGNLVSTGFTFNEVQLNGTAHTIGGSNTFTTLALSLATTQTITFTTGTTQTVTTATLSGSAGHAHTLQSSSAGNNWQITKAGGGQVELDYVDVTDSHGHPDSTWYYGVNGTADAYSEANGWAQSPTTVATITLSAASLIEATTARLNGDITATGGDNPTVTMYWGTTDHPGTSVGWDFNSAPTSPAQPQGVASFYKDVTTLSTGTTYYFTAKAVNSVGTSWPAASLSFLTKPAAPTGISATDGTEIAFVRITWTKSTGATDYHVWRDAVDLGATGDVDIFDDNGASASTIVPGKATASDGTSKTIVTLTLAGESVADGTSYSYKVVASNVTGDSADSATDIGYRGHGVLTYQWQRSAADADAAYSNIVAATTNPYDDMGGVIEPDGRYYQCVLDATGAVQATSTSDRGYLLFLLLAPTNFTSTINGNNIDLSWIKDASATSTYILRGTSSYPTSITDGTLIYNGAGATYSDSNSDISTYYYSAWSYSSTHTVYSIDYATTSNGGKSMAFIGFLALVLAMTFLAFWKKQFALYAISSLLWLGFWAYSKDNPLVGVTQGSLVYDIIYYGSLLAMVAIFFVGLSTRNKIRSMEANGYVFNDGQYVAYNKMPLRPKENLEMTSAEYRAELHRRLNRNKRK